MLYATPFQNLRSNNTPISTSKMVNFTNLKIWRLACADVCFSDQSGERRCFVTAQWQRRAHGQHAHRREEVQSGTASSTRSLKESLAPPTGSVTTHSATGHDRSERGARVFSERLLFDQPKSVVSVRAVRRHRSRRWVQALLQAAG